MGVVNRLGQTHNQTERASGRDTQEKVGSCYATRQLWWSFFYVTLALVLVEQWFS